MDPIEQQFLDELRAIFYPEPDRVAQALAAMLQKGALVIVDIKNRTAAFVVEGFLYLHRPKHGFIKITQ